MILVDISQISIAGLMMQQKINGGMLDEIMGRHFILNTLRIYRNKFKADYGELVICADGKHPWRKDVFANYKAGRKKHRDKDETDWNELYRISNLVLEELDTVFPYKFIRMNNAEADDVIAAITIHERNARTNADYNWLKPDSENIMILSSDHDFKQLQRYERVEQFSPIQKKFVKIKDPIDYLLEHTIKGDKGDGVPNILSNDNVFVSGIRQSTMSAKKLEYFKTTKPEDFKSSEWLRNYNRNQELVDLTKIPDRIYNPIIELYTKPANGSRSKLLSYFIKNRLKHLVEHMGEF